MSDWAVQLLWAPRATRAIIALVAVAFGLRKFVLTTVHSKCAVVGVTCARWTERSCQTSATLCGRLKSREIRKYLLERMSFHVIEYLYILKLNDFCFLTPAIDSEEKTFMAY